MLVRKSRTVSKDANNFDSVVTESDPCSPPVSVQPVSKDTNNVTRKWNFDSVVTESDPCSSPVLVRKRRPVLFFAKDTNKVTRKLDFAYAVPER